MLESVSRNRFIETVSTHIFANPNFLDCIANLNDSKTIYFIFLEKEMPMVAFALMEKGSAIISAKFYNNYSGLWIKQGLKEKKINQVLMQSIACLKNKYDDIKLVLPTNIVDVRPFKWEGFAVDIRYTYIKNLSELNFKTDVRRNYDKAINELKLTFSLSQITDDIWLNYIHQLKTIGFRNVIISLIQKWVTSLERNNLVFTFIIKNEINNEYLGSAIVLIDDLDKKAYLLYNHTFADDNQSQTTAYLYVKLHHWLAEKGYVCLDYLGANFKNIAEFKSNFNPALVPYFTVSYNAKRALFNNFKNNFKKRLKSIISS
jgi:hypothetical protein